jgi:hypothetical protein
MGCPNGLQLLEEPTTAGQQKRRRDEATKRCNEASNVSSLQFLANVKRLIASLLFNFFAVINVSSLPHFPN